MSETETDQETAEGKQHNDSWSATNETWGERFLLVIEANGRERVGERGLLAADEAAKTHLTETSGYRPPHNGKPSKDGKTEFSATFQTEHATMTATLYTSAPSDHDDSELFDVMESTLDDASRLERIAMSVDEDWECLNEVSD